MVDEAYQDRTEWIKKSIRTTAKVSAVFKILTTSTDHLRIINRWASSAPTGLSKTTRRNTGTLKASKLSKLGE
jgi:hypothetical protein